MSSRHAKIIEVSKDTITDICAKYLQEQGNDYFMAYEVDPTKPLSVLWKDMNFIRRNFGVTMFDENSKVTKESLNASRSATIANLKHALKLGVHERDLKNLNEEGKWKMVEKTNDEGKVSRTPMGVPIMVRYKPQAISEWLENYYKEDIAKGLYVICKYV